ncbi:GNAT family N-acetyltransferase [Actinoplanes sp. G11-F43]|uniref:GNAT family N-acetyltransferase n=1 Tax=Actinoplanes sp. G11-F43 TaxID=3424130 RepID=UPI003D330108
MYEFAEWSLVAHAADGAMAGWASIRSWTEDDGVRVYLTRGEVRAEDRRRGLGGRLLDETEAAVRALTATQPATGPVMLGGNATEGDHGREALLLSRGYRRALTMVVMRREPGPVPDKPLPEGFQARTVTADDAEALRRLSERAWAGRPFTRLPSADQLRDWLRRSDLTGFEVATTGDRIAGFAAVVGDEIDDLQVDPDFQRRGIASALLGRALTRIGGPARLRTEGHDPAGARSLYERFGFRVTESHHRYRKPLR